MDVETLGEHFNPFRIQTKSPSNMIQFSCSSSRRADVTRRIVSPVR
jgi:hypothetical protein